MIFIRILHCPRDPFSDCAAHTSHKEAAVHHRNHRGNAADGSRFRNGRFGKSRFLLGLFQLLTVSREIQQVFALQAPVQFSDASFIEYRLEPLLTAHGAVMSAEGADVQVLLPGGGLRPSSAALAVQIWVRQHFLNPALPAPHLFLQLTLQALYAILQTVLHIHRVLLFQFGVKLLIYFCIYKFPPYYYLSEFLAVTKI